MKSYHFIFNGFKKFKSKSGFLAFNFYLSVFLIAFSLMAIILTDSFTSGYKNEILTSVKSLNPDYKITPNISNYISQDDYTTIKESINNTKLYLVPFIETAGVIINKITKDDITYSQREEVYINGLDFNIAPKNLPLRNFLKNNNSEILENEIIIGKYLSDRLGKYINDQITILFYNSSQMSFFAKNYIISNIYDTGTQADDYIVYVSISSINESKSKYYSDGIYLYKENNKEKIDLNYSDPLFNVEKLSYDNLVKFLNTFDLPIKFLMWILLFLSCYTLTSLTYNFILDKKDDFKILHILGFSYTNLRRLMIFLTLYISVIGIIIGSFLSLLFIYLQNNFEIITLPSRKIFQISILTANIDLYYFIIYPILILFLSFLLTYYFFNKNLGIIKND